MKREGFDVTWEAEDGYCGGSRPHHFIIRADELEGNEDDKDLSRLFWDLLQNDFEEKVSPVSQDEEKFIEWAKSELAKTQSE